MTDSLSCMAETNNIVKQLHSNKNQTKQSLFTLSVSGARNHIPDPPFLTLCVFNTNILIILNPIIQFNFLVNFL